MSALVPAPPACRTTTPMVRVTSLRPGWLWDKHKGLNFPAATKSSRGGYGMPASAPSRSRHPRSYGLP